MRTTPPILPLPRLFARADDPGAWQTVATRPLRGGEWSVAVAGATVEGDAVDGEVRVHVPVAGAQGFGRLVGSL